MANSVPRRGKTIDCTNFWGTCEGQRKGVMRYCAIRMPFVVMAPAPCETPILSCLYRAHQNAWRCTGCGSWKGSWGLISWDFLRARYRKKKNIILSSFYPHSGTSLNLHQILPWIFILILSSFYAHFILILSPFPHQILILSAFPHQILILSSFYPHFLIKSSFYPHFILMSSSNPHFIPISLSNPHHILFLSSFYPRFSHQILILSSFSILILSSFPHQILIKSSFYLHFILILSLFPHQILIKSSFYPHFILILSPFPHQILILSSFYPHFILILSPFPHQIFILSSFPHQILILFSFYPHFIYLHFILISGLNEVHETGCGSQNLISLISKAGLQLAESQKKKQRTREVKGEKMQKCKVWGIWGERTTGWKPKSCLMCVYI